MPLTISVKEKEKLKPSHIRIHGAYVRIYLIIDEWEVNEDWWTNQPIDRRYFKVILDNGREMVLFKDLSNNLWYKQRFA